MKQSWLATHAETIAQNLIGQILYFAILWAFGLPLATIGSLQVVCFFVGYSRSYAIRRFFDWWQHRKAVDAEDRPGIRRIVKQHYTSIGSITDADIAAFDRACEHAKSLDLHELDQRTLESSKP